MSDSSNAPMPTLETQKKIVDAYLAAFRRTPLVMLMGGGEMFTYAIENGAGWRADSLGDMGGFSKTWSHMRMAYPQLLPQADALDVWKRRRWPGRRAGTCESGSTSVGRCGSSSTTPWLYTGPSLTTNPLHSRRGSVRAEVARFLRRLGYRLVISELKHSKQVKPGDNLVLTMKWHNVGSAPCYKPYRLAYRLTNNQGDKHVAVSKITVDTWLPGEIELFTDEFFTEPADLPPGKLVDVADSIRLPDGLSPGNYTLAIAVVGEEDSQPVVQLGIKGRSDDGWYPMSTVIIAE